jgi:hypothetical protein
MGSATAFTLVNDRFADRPATYWRILGYHGDNWIPPSKLESCMKKKPLTLLIVFCLAGCAPSRDANETPSAKVETTEESEVSFLDASRRKFLVTLKDYSRRYPLQEERWEQLRDEAEAATSDEVFLKVVYEAHDQAIQSELHRQDQARRPNAGRS